MRREWPPRSKKLSSMPMPGTPRVAWKMSHSSASRWVRGFRPPSFPPPVISGAGSARRSTFPLPDNGNVSRATTIDGTM
jgi:hypothetical protein